MNKIRINNIKVGLAIETKNIISLLVFLTIRTKDINSLLIF